MYNIATQIENIFPNSTKKDWGKYKMPTNQGHYFPITFDLKDKSRAMVSCQDWNKETGINDNLKVSLFAADYSEYLKRQINYNYFKILTHIGYSEKVFFMRFCIAVLVLILSLQFSTKADDISDFQIEGMSVGDSLLQFYDKKQLEDIKHTNQFKKKIHNKYCDNTISEIYFDICIYTLKKDKKFKIESIAGFIDCKHDISICYKKQK